MYTTVRAHLTRDSSSGSEETLPTSNGSIVWSGISSPRDGGSSRGSIQLDIDGTSERKKKKIDAPMPFGPSPEYEVDGRLTGVYDSYSYVYIKNKRASFL